MTDYPAKHVVQIPALSVQNMIEIIQEVEIIQELRQFIVMAIDLVNKRVDIVPPFG
jgi:hypothetical protein